ncbi:sugar transporter [Rhizoctonia solani AG-1 IA]|uniref:Sugar transporter n=1 Tax=Thanatephorus cucumeris (strain AG1-IA) TaxID=983506 RepID=L8WQ73_THACA|nr:sugar transporter [Rhizoctonia solani AG-1 IA]
MVMAIYLCCQKYGLAAVVKYYGIPCKSLLKGASGSHICTTRILYSLTTGIPSGRSKEALQQQLTGTLFIAILKRPPSKPLITPSRDFLGWQGRFFLHDDHGAEATQYLSAFLGGHYMHSSEPVFQALWNTYNECQFVEDEGVYFKVTWENSMLNFILLGNVLFYRNKRGEAQRRSVHEVQISNLKVNLKTLGSGLVTSAPFAMSHSAPTDGKLETSHHERPTRTLSSNESESSLSRGQQLASDEEIEKYRPRFRGARLNAFLAFIAGTGFTLFGYDQGVLSALLTTESVGVSTSTQNQTNRAILNSTQEFGPPNHATLQSLLVAIYEIGCLIGFVPAANQLRKLWVGEKLGRRRTIAVGGIIMIIGAILQTASFSYAQMLVAYHAECASPEKREAMGINIEGSFFVKNSSAQWRAPVALQIVFALVMIIGVELLPDSPRWLVNQGRYAEALAVISALEDKPHDHPDVQRTFLAIREAALTENTISKKGEPQHKFNLRELFHGGRSQNFRRATLGIVIQAFQQITESWQPATIGTEYFLASLIAVWLIEKVGRRKLMIFGAIGQTITMVLLAVLGSIDRSSTNLVSAVLLFVFNSFFAIGWLGMTWLYPAEITPLRIRQPANALSTASNWAFNFMVVMVTGPSFENIGYHTYTVFACLNAFIIPVVYFYFPETAGRSLEDMDVVFAQAYNEGISPVSVSLRKDVPPAGSPEADEILGFGIRRRNNASDPSPDQTRGAHMDVEKQG